MQKTELVALEENPYFRIVFEAHVRGKKLPLKPSEIVAIYEKLCEQKNLRDLVLFTMGIDVMYRSSDILKTKVKDVQDSRGEIIVYQSVKQEKTKNSTCSMFMDTTRLLLGAWIRENDFGPSDYIFPGRYNGTHLGERRHRYIIKEWVSLIGLAPEFYSTHTMRRSKSVIIYLTTQDIASIRCLLGQKSLSSTQEYLGIEDKQALYQSSRFDFFDPKTLIEHGLIEAKAI